MEHHLAYVTFFLGGSRRKIETPLMEVSNVIQSSSEIRRKVRFTRCTRRLVQELGKIRMLQH